MSTTTACLIVSGVNISKNPEEDPANTPYPDYLLLREILNPSIIDISTIITSGSWLIHLVYQFLGIYWAVAIAAYQAAANFEVVLATGEDIGLRIGLLYKFLGRRVPLIITCHNISTRRPAFFLGKLKIGSVVSRFLCLSRSQAQILTQRYHISPERIQTIYWAVDHHFFEPTESKPVKNQICSAGMASRDYATLVEATKSLNVNLKIASDSPWFQQALNISSDQLSQKVEARSFGNYAALRRLYSESLFVVVPLLDVDFSAGYTVILEAMAMGKAVIVTRTRQVDDFVVDGENGFHVRPGDVQDLMGKITYLLEHPDEARRMGANGRCRVTENYTLNHYLQNINIALKSVTSSS